MGQVTVWLLFVHFLLTPVQTSSLDTLPPMVFVFAFVFVFIFWAMYAVAGKLENPFGTDEVDLDMKKVQDHFNDRLLMLLSSAAIQNPSLDCLDGIMSSSPLPDEVAKRPSLSPLASIMDLEALSNTSSESERDKRAPKSIS